MAVDRWRLGVDHAYRRRRLVSPSASHWRRCAMSWENLPAYVLWWLFAPRPDHALASAVWGLAGAVALLVIVLVFGSKK
jgi:hypothetical protein